MRGFVGESGTVVDFASSREQHREVIVGAKWGSLESLKALIRSLDGHYSAKSVVAEIAVVVVW